MGDCVEGLYYSRPIQCLASSEILTPPPPHRPASVVRGRTHSLGGEGVGGVNSSEDARHCSLLYICKYFMGVCDNLQRGCPEVPIQQQKSKLLLQLRCTSDPPPLCSFIHSFVSRYVPEDCYLSFRGHHLSHKSGTQRKKACLSSTC